MNKFVLLILILGGLCSCSQELKCDDLKKGNFIVPDDSEQTKPYRILKDNETQVEIDSEGIKRYSKIKWLDACSYILTYDGSKMDLNDFQKQINGQGGIKVEITKIENNCYYYISSIQGDDRDQSIEGVMCRE